MVIGIEANVQKPYFFYNRKNFHFCSNEDPELKANDEIELICDGKCIVSLVLSLTNFTIIYVDTTK